MNVLIIGSGGREHAIAHKLAESKELDKLYISPGNSGTSTLGENVELPLKDFQAVQQFVDDKSLDLIVVGPEQPLVDGICDFFETHTVKVVGPSSIGAQLEGSKDFAKSFMNKYNIPTAAYGTFTAESLEKAYKFLDSLESPYVLKADGLAGGKGVLIIEDIQEAKEELKNMLIGDKFGNAGSKVVIEEYLEGIEMSVFVLTDGKDYLILPEAKDYKRIGEKDTGLNTGGMGAVSPVPFADNYLKQQIEKHIVKPSIEGIHQEKMNYKGFLFIGLMIKGGKAYVIEYNVRMGDPETEVVMPRIKSDFLLHLTSLFNGKLSEQKLQIDPAYASTVILVSKGYPESYEKGKKINGLEKCNDSLVFHSGTKSKDGEILTNGGRVLAITGKGDTLEEALSNSYKNAKLIEFDGKYFRKDIGYDLK